MIKFNMDMAAHIVLYICIVLCILIVIVGASGCVSHIEKTTQHTVKETFKDIVKSGYGSATGYFIVTEDNMVIKVADTGYTNMNHYVVWDKLKPGDVIEIDWIVYGYSIKDIRVIK